MLSHVLQGHLQLQVSSLKILTLLADGMRAEFSGTVRPLTQAIIFKAKEKRLVSEVQAALVSILRYCIGFDAIAEDLLEQIKSKKSPPHTRCGLMEFVITALTEISEKVTTDNLKAIADAHISSCEDSDPKVRDCATLVLVALAPLVKKRGKAASEASKLLVGLEQSNSR